MKLGVLSDTHNDSEATRRALAIFRDRGVEQLIHCGDVTTPEIVALFEGWSIDFVYGNMDRDQSALRQAVGSLEQASIDDTQVLYIDGRRIAVTHGHWEDTLAELIRGEPDYVFHGHTHIRRHDTIGRTQVINPGALGGTRRQARSVCVVDLDAGDVTFVKLDQV